MDKKPMSHRLMDYLRDNPTATNEELSNALKAQECNVRSLLSRLNTRGWVKVNGKNGNRTVEVIKGEDEEPSIKEYKRDTYFEMLPKALDAYNQATNAEELNVTAKIVFKILDNI